MSMAKEIPRDEAGKTREPEIASADLLFRDEPAGRPAKPAASAPPAGDRGEVFDLAPEPEVASRTPPVSKTVTHRPGEPEADRPRQARASRTEGPAREDPSVLVEEVWSRSAEWGPNLIFLAGWLFASAILVYSCMSNIGLLFLLLLVGGAGTALLSYPILITLERPVRMTPEQAVRDFYGALSHHFPHYRRMWLLLSTAGRTNSSYGSFEGFKAYWADRIRTIKGSQAGAMTPLVFEVVEYRGDKSAGQTRIEAKFTLKIAIRGRRQEGPIASIPAVVGLVRGPDNMWYLDSGTLPKGTPEKSRRSSG
jgi:hypothetical protein